MLGVSALHYSTRSWKGFWTLASAHVLDLTTHYSCPSISGVHRKLQGYLEVSGVVWEFIIYPELSVVQMWSIEVTNKDRVLEVTNIISRSSETEVQEFGGSEQGQVDNEMRIKVNI